MDFVHYCDPNGIASARGTYAEEEYKNKLKSRKIVFREANRFEQRMHWDIIIQDDKKMEVKGFKRFDRYDARGAEGFILLELHGCQYYNHGWLKGDADWIAFHQANGSFIHFQRKKLLDWITEKIGDNTAEVYEKPCKTYQIYHRWNNRYEKFVWCPLADIAEALPHHPVLK